MLGASRCTVWLRAKKGLLEARISENYGRKDVRIPLAAVLPDNDPDLPEERAAPVDYEAMLASMRPESARQ